MSVQVRNELAPGVPDRAPGREQGLRVVVTGASGNLGTALLDALRRDGRVGRIVGLARRLPAVRLAKVEWRSVDVATGELRPHFEGADAVIHLAWLIQPSRDPALLRAVNVEGSMRVFRAARECGVGRVLYASSVGAYSIGPKDERVDESWPVGGIESSFYSRHKAEVEAFLDRFEAEDEAPAVVRMRPALIFRRDAASGIRRLFLGPFFPGALLRAGIPVVPSHPRLRFQAIHGADVAEAFRAAVHSEARGPFNLAAEPVLDSAGLAELFGARQVPVAAPILRRAADLSWRFHLQPTPAGWVDMGLGVPLMDSTRAHEELGWRPRVSATSAVSDLVDGLRVAAGYPTPPLDRHAGGRFRIGELTTGLGRRSAAR